MKIWLALISAMLELTLVVLVFKNAHWSIGLAVLILGLMQKVHSYIFMMTTFNKKETLEL